MRTEKIMLFPEGTRSRDGQLQAGKRTIGKLIYQARPVVVPAALLGTEHILPRLAAWLGGRTPVTVRYGAPLDLQPYYDLPDGKSTAEAIVQALMEAIAALLAAPPEGPGAADAGRPYEEKA